MPADIRYILHGYICPSSIPETDYRTLMIADQTIVAPLQGHRSPRRETRYTRSLQCALACIGPSLPGGPAAGVADGEV
jgi:hypothetical protein